MINIRQDYPLLFYKMREALNSPIRFLKDKHYPLATEEDFSSPVFIVGTGRCGTTLLREILNSHDRISFPPEGIAIYSSAKFFLRNRYWDWKDLVSFVLSKFQFTKYFPAWDIEVREVYDELENIEPHRRSYAIIVDTLYRKYAESQQKDVRLWGDQSPINSFRISWIQAIWPSAKLIHLYRDPRDVCRSYLESDLFNTFDEALNRTHKALERIESTTDPLEVYELSYENLVQNPKKEVQSLSNYLGLDFRKEMLRHDERKHAEDIDEYEYFENVKNPINDDSVGKWKNELNKPQVNKIENTLEDWMKSKNYL